MNDKIPPHNLEFEAALLGCLVISPNEILWEFLSRYAEGEKFFYELRNAKIFRAILNLAGSRKPVNTVTVSEEMKRMSDPTPVDNCYLAGLPDLTPSAHNMTHYADELQTLFRRREIIRISQQASTKAFEGESDALEFAEREILAIGRDTADEAEISMKDLAIAVVEQLDENFRNRGRLIGVPTGFADIDRKTRGFKPGQMIVIGARPGHGKTGLAMNIVDYAAINCGIPVGVFSMEMTKEELMKRLLCARAQVPSDDLENANLSEAQQADVRAALGKIAKSPIHIQDPSGITVFQLAARARRMVHRHGIKLLVVDYLQLLHGRNKQNRTQEMTEVSNALKNLAKELKIPAIVLAQLNRSNEKDNREPQLSDLRDSGSIEQDADIVGLLHPKPGKDQVENSDMPTELLLKKHRNGPTGCIHLLFRRAITRFEAMARP